jgi:hypothetical protein
MARIHDTTLRQAMVVGAVVAGLGLGSEADAGCIGNIFTNYNTCYGAGVLGSVTAGYNTGIGYSALYLTTTGTGNTATGANALLRNVGGSNNTANGISALRLNTASNNTAIGSFALGASTVGTANTAVGVYALGASTPGSYNTAIGMYALQSGTASSYNTASGYGSLRRNTSGGYNTASGGNALANNTTGNSNTATGNGALYSNSTGFRNVALGWNAGYAVTGSDNIVIGASNNGLTGENGVTRIGISTYQKKAFIAGIRGVQTGSTGAVAVLIDANGQLGTINSSRRFKEDIQTMGSVSERLFALRPVTFKYKQPYEDGSKPVQYGLVAEEVAKVFPELVVYGKDGKPETVSYHLLATLLLNEVQKDHRVMQAQPERIASLEKQTARTEALEQQVRAQAAQLAALNRQVAVLARLVGNADKAQMVASARSLSDQYLDRRPGPAPGYLSQGDSYSDAYSLRQHTGV